MESKTKRKKRWILFIFSGKEARRNECWRNSTPVKLQGEKSTRMRLRPQWVVDPLLHFELQNHHAAFIATHVFVHKKWKTSCKKENKCDRIRGCVCMHVREREGVCSCESVYLIRLCLYMCVWTCVLLRLAVWGIWGSWRYRRRAWTGRGHAGAEMVEKIIFTPTHHFHSCPHPAITQGLHGHAEEETQTSSLLSVRLFFLLSSSFLSFYFYKTHMLTVCSPPSAHLSSENKSLSASNETFSAHTLYTATCRAANEGCKFTYPRFLPHALLTLIPDKEYILRFFLQLYLTVSV